MPKKKLMSTHNFFPTFFNVLNLSFSNATNVWAIGNDSMNREGELRGNCEIKFVTLICLLHGFMIIIREYKRLLKQYKKQLKTLYRQIR